jgi:hypothetical protein
MGSVADPSGDAFYSANGSRTPAGDNLDLTGASLANGPGNTIIATIHAKNLSNLTVPTSSGGPDGSWLIRWTQVRPGTTGNGDIYYVGMDNNQGAGGASSPSFFAGDTVGIPPANAAEHTKYLAYPQTHTLSGSQASYSARTGTITLTVPRADVGNPSDGTRLFSATGFSASSATPQSSTTLFNLTDATTPFELVVGAPGTGGSGSGSGSNGSGGSGNCPKATGRLSGRQLGVLSLGTKRSKARHALSNFSTHGRRYMDFYCLRGGLGIRGGYPSPALLRHLRHKTQRALNGRLVLLLTANRHYALKGVRPNTKLTKKVARKLRIGRRYHVGKNYWYVTPNGSTHGILKVVHGRIQEIGVADKRVTGSVKPDRLFLRTFGF